MIPFVLLFGFSTLLITSYGMETRNRAGLLSEEASPVTYTISKTSTNFTVHKPDGHTYGL